MGSRKNSPKNRPEKISKRFNEKITYYYFHNSKKFVNNVKCKIFIADRTLLKAVSKK